MRVGARRRIAIVRPLSCACCLSPSVVPLPLAGCDGRDLQLYPLYTSHLLCAAVCIRNRCMSIVNQIVATKLKHRGPPQLHVDGALESYCMAALFSPRITFTVMLSGSEEWTERKEAAGTYTGALIAAATTANATSSWPSGGKYDANSTWRRRGGCGGRLTRIAGRACIIARIGGRCPCNHELTGPRETLRDDVDAAPVRVVYQVPVLVPVYKQGRQRRLPGHARQINVAAALDVHFIAGQDFGLRYC